MTTMEAARKYESDLERFKLLGGEVNEEFPKLDDYNSTYCVDCQYLFMGDWAFRKIYADKPVIHYDVGGQISWLFWLSNFVPIKHIDIRDPQLFNTKRFEYIKGDITALPFEDNSIQSLSCLHVAEHIGLGRFGDNIDPNGFRKACNELKRVLAVNGKLYFAVPMGKPKVVFNAHRVINSKMVMDLFDDLSLEEFASHSSDGGWLENADVTVLDDDKYGCGMFLFRNG